MCENRKIIFNRLQKITTNKLIPSHSSKAILIFIITKRGEARDGGRFDSWRGQNRSVWCLYRHESGRQGGDRSVQGRAKAISIGTPRQRERRRDVQSITRDPAAMLVALISAVIHSKHF